jgi:hypothetical protein
VVDFVGTRLVEKTQRKKRQKRKNSVEPSQTPFAQRIITHPSDMLWQYRNLLYQQTRLCDGIEVTALVDQLCGQIPPHLDSIATRQQLQEALVAGILPRVVNPSHDYATVIANLHNFTPHTQHFHIAQLRLALTPVWLPLPMGVSLGNVARCPSYRRMSSYTKRYGLPMTSTNNKS